MWPHELDIYARSSYDEKLGIYHNNALDAKIMELDCYIRFHNGGLQMPSTREEVELL